MATIPEIWQRFQTPGTPENPVKGAALASATSITVTHPFHNVTGTTDIANIAPPYVGFVGIVKFLFAAATPPDFVSGGTPAAGFYAVALTKSPAQYEVVTLYFDGVLWYPAMT